MNYLGIKILESVVDDKPIMDGSLYYDFGNGAIVCLIAILLVFIVLLVIIAISACISKVIDYVISKQKVENPVEEKKEESLVIDVNNEDMMAAILVSSIDYRNEIKKDVKVVSIREVK